MKNLELKKIFRNKYAIRVAAGVVTVAVLGTSAGVNLYTVQAENPCTAELLFSYNSGI
jgi:putative membrane protein